MQTSPSTERRRWYLINSTHRSDELATQFLSFLLLTLPYRSFSLLFLLLFLCFLLFLLFFSFSFSSLNVIPCRFECFGVSDFSSISNSFSIFSCWRNQSGTGTTGLEIQRTNPNLLGGRQRRRGRERGRGRRREG